MSSILDPETKQTKFSWSVRVGSDVPTNLDFVLLSVPIDYVWAELIRLDESLRLQVCRSVQRGGGGVVGITEASWKAVLQCPSASSMHCFTAYMSTPPPTPMTSPSSGTVFTTAACLMAIFCLLKFEALWDKSVIHLLDSGILVLFQTVSPLLLRTGDSFLMGRVGFFFGSFTATLKWSAICWSPCRMVFIVHSL